ncbi:MAG: hypothetical protein J6Y07_02425 [Alphaproteobacteria bacterium]|nr:hypothetical protein [Alphaproteobacteria bacterium]
MFNDLRQLFLITCDIKRKYRRVQHLQNKNLDAKETVTAVPVNRCSDSEMGKLSRMHCVFLYLQQGIPDDNCKKYSTHTYCNDSDCQGFGAHKQYIRTTRKLQCAEREYRELLAARRIMFRKLLGRGGK